MNAEEERRKRLQLIATYTSLPFALAIPPICGWYIGSWMDKQFATAPYGMYTLLFLGVVGGGREFYHIITKYKDEEP